MATDAHMRVDARVDVRPALWRIALRRLLRACVALLTWTAGAIDRTREFGAELLVAVALLLGWVSLTLGIRALTWGRATSAVWPLSIGLLLLSLCGWRFLATLASRGLYALTRDAPRE